MVNRTSIMGPGCSPMDFGDFYRMKDIWRKVRKKRDAVRVAPDCGQWRGCNDYSLYDWERNGKNSVRERH